MEYFIEVLSFLENLYWAYVGWVIICAFGIYLTIISRGLQFRALFNFRKNIKDIFCDINSKTSTNSAGVHPIKLYFASVGGMVGLGNIVGISVALMIGGPGSIFWIIITSIFGALLKYSEIYLGIKYRVRKKNGGYCGGVMYFIQKAFKSKFLSILVAVLICLYGIEVYQFLVLVDRIETSFSINRNLVILMILSALIYTAMGGVNRLANICTVIMPLFMVSYIGVSLYIICVNIAEIPNFVLTIINSAFTGHAKIGGFAGSTMIMTSYLGVSKTVYSGDIGIGYDSIVQSETKISSPEKQATLAIYALFSDTFICLLTNFTLGITGAWYKLNNFDSAQIVSIVLSEYIPFANLFVTLLLFFAGFTTLIAYLTAGVKCAEFINRKYGKIVYLILAVFVLVIICRFPQESAFKIMNLIGGVLVLLNLVSILKLRKEIKF